MRLHLWDLGLGILLTFTGLPAAFAVGDETAMAWSDRDRRRGTGMPDSAKRVVTTRLVPDAHGRL